MSTLKLATWNINSVRLRIDHVARFLSEESPDVLFLQEIKCAEDQFPGAPLRALGYEHIAVSGQKGYHGVATLSRIPFEKVERKAFCGKGDARHLATTLPGGVTAHNFYVPSGGDEPDRAVNEKFDHKLNFLSEMAAWFGAKRGKTKAKMILVGDLNVAPRPSDVWSHKQLLNVVSHTPIEVEHLEAVRAAHSWIDVARDLLPEPEPLFTWWSYRARDWRASNRGRRLDHIWVTEALRSAATGGGRDRFAIHDAARDWDKPSDHVPVSLTLDWPT